MLTITVAQDGSGDFASVSEAVLAVPYDCRAEIHIGPGTYREKLVATIRSREISACLVLQAQSQLKAIYKDNADTIIGNMDTSIFLGGKEPTTLKELAAVLGKETIDTYNTGESRGRETSHSLNYQKLGKDMTYLFVKSSVALNFTRTGTRSTGF